MNIIYATADKCIMEASRLITEQEEGLIVNFGDKKWCACGKMANIREDVCTELDIPILRANYLAGANVVFPGDLSIMEVKKGHSRFGEKAIKKVCEYLHGKKIPVSLSGNDLMLIDAQNRAVYKVGSYGSNHVGNMTESVFHISINMDLDLVKRICLKPMTKIPGELSSYDITAEELWQVIIKEYDKSK